MILSHSLYLNKSQKFMDVYYYLKLIYMKRFIHKTETYILSTIMITIKKKKIVWYTKICGSQLMFSCTKFLIFKNVNKTSVVLIFEGHFRLFFNQ